MAGPGPIHEWSADSLVRVFLASTPVRADRAVRAPIPALLEYALWPAQFLGLVLGHSLVICHFSLEIPNRDFPLSVSDFDVKVWA